MSDSNENKPTETEAQLIERAQSALNNCNWVVGECAGTWTVKYAKGRTDAEFGNMVGLSADQVYQRRRVWETFGDVCENYPALKWSHFYVALNWDDAPECLQWSEENQTTVAEMKAWRRMQRGDDLTEAANPDEFPDEMAVQYMPTEPSFVQEPGEFGSTGGYESGDAPFDADSPSGERTPVVAGHPREVDGSGGDTYSPFRQGAMTPPKKEESSAVAVAPRPQPSAEQIIKKMTASLEKCEKALSPQVLAGFPKLNEELRSQFITAVEELSAKVSELS